MQCPDCGSEDVEYIGIDDGGGDYGDCLVDLWYCVHCDGEFEGHAIPIIEYDGDTGEDVDWPEVQGWGE